MSEQTDRTETDDKTVVTADTAVKTETKGLKRNTKEWLFIYILRQLFHNLALLIDGIYDVIKKTLKFWWIMLIILITIYPQPIIQLIETVKNFFN